MALNDRIVITAEDAADYVGVTDPSVGQTKALTRLGRAAVENVGLYLNRDFVVDGVEMPVPAAVEEACYRMLADLYEGTPASDSPAAKHLASVKVDDVTLSYQRREVNSVDNTVSGPVLALLKPYRLGPGL